MAGDVAIGLDGLSTDDLSGLRLAAQVMAQRAQRAGRPRVVLWFESLEALVMAEQAGRGQKGKSGAATGGRPLPLGAAGGRADGELLDECLALLIDNERLSDAVRRVCRALRVSCAA